jgi:RimJ/RimL family protein N-acetyltransferase
VVGRVVLIPLGPQHVDDLVALDAEPAVMRYISDRPTPRATIERIVDDTAGQRWAGTVDGEFIGWYSLRPSAPGERELGYRLRQAAWGHGYATRGATMLIDRAFRQPEVRRVWAQTMAVNRRSRAVLERCGLRYVRTFHLEWEVPLRGAELGEVEYEITRSEWPLGSAAASWRR